MTSVTDVRLLVHRILVVGSLICKAQTVRFQCFVNEYPHLRNAMQERNCSVNPLTPNDL
jgi:hypothetical protein